MTWMKVADGKLESNIVRFFTPDEQAGILRRFDAADGDVLIMIADEDLNLTNKILGNLRLHLARRLSLIPDEDFYPIWITDFPMFEQDGEHISSVHHPFTLPAETGFDPLDRHALLQLKSRAYDLVMNGEELGGGSLRIHRMELQKKVFQALGLSPEAAEAKFGFFLRALEFGAPPHGGIALGLDRVVAMILKLHSIRDVIAFPKNRSAVCPMTQAPSHVDPVQLEELALSSPEQTGREVEPKPLPTTGHGERISTAEVRHVAKLARLQLEESEISAYKNDLNSILEYVDRLSTLKTDNVEPMHHVLKVKNVWRDDRAGTEKVTREILRNAPQQENDCFKVPKILEG